MFQESKTPFCEVLNFVLLAHFSLITGLWIATLSSLRSVNSRKNCTEDGVSQAQRVRRTKCCKFPIHFWSGAPSYEYMHSHKPLQFRIFLHFPWSLLEDTWWSNVNHAIIPSVQASIESQLLTTLLYQITTQCKVCEKSNFSFLFKHTHSTLPRQWSTAHFSISKGLPVEAKLKRVT